MSYPPPQPGYQPQMPPQDHPRAMMSLILGIVSLVACSLLGPFAWSIGKKTVSEIDASGGQRAVAAWHWPVTSAGSSRPSC